MKRASSWRPLNEDGAANDFQLRFASMHETLEPRKPPVADKDTGRIEAFSDGVFSIAMTLLVLDLQVPTPVMLKQPTAAALWGFLGQHWTSYFAFITSFATVLIMWMNHHAIFRLIRKSNGRLLFANGFLLLLVTAVPFPTALVSAYLRTPAATAACAVYAGMFVLISVSYGLVMVAVRSTGHLLMPGSKAEIDSRIRKCYLVGTPLYSLATIAAFFSPWLSLGICSGLWAYWAVVGMSSERAFAD